MVKEEDKQHLIGPHGIALNVSDEVGGTLDISDDIEHPIERSALFSSIEQSKEIAANCCQNKT